MAKARPLSELGYEINRALRCVDEKLPLPAGASLSATETQDRLNLRQEAFGRVLTELLDNEYT